jgi:hypothetical protein
MTKRLVALAAGALAVLLISSTFDAADARGRGGWGGGGGRGYSGGHARAFSGRAFSAPRFYGGSSYRAYSYAAPHVHRHRHIRRGLAVGVPLGIYGAYAYTSGCDWLRRKAYYTGSGYWMDRYYACVNGYY